VTIEKAAINYRAGTPDKCCAKCYQVETRLASGLWCNQFDCKTNPGRMVRGRRDIAEG
jgi:hypothetical protein